MLTPSQLRQFEEDGYLVLPEFLSNQEVASLEAARARIVDGLDPAEHRISIFTTLEDRQVDLRAKDDYFLESGDKVRFFWEEGAFNSAGELTVDRSLAINKIGHALHWLVPEFRAVTFSDKVRALCRSLRFSAPAVAQSMYIFKQPGIGGEVTPHQDATFLYTEPPSAIAGLWMALEDADVENGCLWFAPGSHKGPVTRRFVRNPDPAGPRLLFRGQQQEVDPEAFVPVPVKRGGCVLISGLVQHRSSANTSARSRHIYTFHVVETDGAEYSEENWLQPTAQLPFPKL
ncbi:phytanoyl-CoA dioxygenase domain-containing protein 1-like [Amphibalanus amphitrite]|uniref:phytanoyl-CoA dioxygenase domain-containing protein 1-like n=1 Tax=Amphibalanus amphitrite TaxID=1232801 RepID=UPI001C9191E3|nr:phytanoyl-CoA dioxygenase domain-containing protein 1-like [Amphibalanus amphitrite]